MMPEMDGLEFIRRVREQPHNREVPIVMVTADSEREVRYRALELGANDFLNKPVDKVELLARVKNLLALRRSQRQLRNRAHWLTGEVKKATAEIRERERDTIFRLSRAAEYRDPETGSHIVRMAHYSRLIARNLGLSGDDQELLFEAAPMHDIGKVGIPDGILLKPGRLDEEEFKLMKQHSAFGFEILQGSQSRLMQAAAEIALTHHERYDGGGYPRGLAGDEIPLFGRIVAVADVFDALTSERPYKKAWPLEQAMTLLKESAGSHFDADCVAAFLQNWESVLEIRRQYRDEYEEESMEALR